VRVDACAAIWRACLERAAVFHMPHLAAVFNGMV